MVKQSTSQLNIQKHQTVDALDKNRLIEEKYVPYNLTEEVTRKTASSSNRNGIQSVPPRTKAERENLAIK